MERAQVRLLLEQAGDEWRAKAASQRKAMHADHSARGCLRSGATVTAALRMVEELVGDYVKQIVAAVGDISQDTEAFGMIVTEVSIMLRHLKLEVDQSVVLVTHGATTGPVSSIATQAKMNFREIEKRALQLVEIHRFTFTKPTQNRESAASGQTVALFQPTLAPKNKGGKPLAEHWDEMWATIAVLLWDGKLVPKKQGDIKKAMFAWFVERGIEVGDTAVTDRARQLWRLLEPKL